MMQELVQAIETTCKSLMNNIHTAMPATITAYANGRIDAKINGKYYVGGQPYDYPMITGCPVITMSGGMATPISVGDFCLLIFTEQSISEWTSGTQTHNDEKWSLSNAIALCGLTMQASPLQEQAQSAGGPVANALTSNGAVVAQGMNVKEGIEENAGRIDSVEEDVGALGERVDSAEENISSIEEQLSYSVENATLKPTATSGTIKCYKTGKIVVVVITNLILASTVSADTLVAELPFAPADTFRGDAMQLNGNAIAIWCNSNGLYVSGINTPTNSNIYGSLVYIAN